MRVSLVKENKRKQPGRQEKPEPCVTRTHAGKARAASLKQRTFVPSSSGLELSVWYIALCGALAPAPKPH